MRELLVAMLLIAAGTLPAAESDFPRVPVFDRHVRGGLPNVAARLAAGKPVSVAYLGGSITEARGGWRDGSLDFLRRSYPGVEFTPIPAGIGGTGSLYGAFRLGEQVLSFRPDLIFVEFAVNDSWQKPEDIVAGMEGIVRQVWSRSPTTDVVFVYTATRDDMKELLAGKCSRSISVMEKVAGHYCIPSVLLIRGVIPMVREGKWVMSASKHDLVPGSDADGSMARLADGRVVFSIDGTHPLPSTGHVMYTEALRQALPEFFRAGIPGAHSLPEPISRNFIGKIAELSAFDSRVQLSGGSSTRNGEYRVFKPGDKLSVRFCGSRLGMSAVMAAYCGAAEFSLDGKIIQKCRNFSFSNPNFDYQPFLELASGLDPEKTHVFTLRALPEQAVDKRKLYGELVEKEPGRFLRWEIHVRRFYTDGEFVQSCK